jgi:Tol biopolymer transport system component
VPERILVAPHIEEPRFSFSGKWISCLSGHNVHVISREPRTHTVVSECTRAQWLPGADELLVNTREGLQIFSPVNDWSEPVGMLRLAEAPLLFSADGREIIYSDAVSGGGPGAGGEPMRTGRLCRLALDNRNAEPKILASLHQSRIIPSCWSSTTNSVIYWLDEDFSASLIADGLELFRIPASGGSARSLNVRTLVYGDMIALSPRQDSLAVTAGEGREEWEHKRIAIVDLRTAKVSYRTAPDLAAACPTWSPDARQLAFCAAPAPTGQVGGGDEAERLLQQRRIWICDANGVEKPEAVTHDDRYRDEEPIWSADGRYILFGRIDRSNNKTLWLMKVNGAGPIQVTGVLGNPPLDDAWFGYYGYVDWTSLFDWHRS